MAKKRRRKSKKNCNRYCKGSRKFKSCRRKCAASKRKAAKRDKRRYRRRSLGQRVRSRVGKKLRRCMKNQFPGTPAILRFKLCKETTKR